MTTEPQAVRRSRLARTGRIARRRLTRAARGWRSARHALTALAAGAAGGGILTALGLPAAWLTGSMIAVAGLSLAGVRMRAPMPLCAAAFVLLGISMGGRFDGDLLAELRQWPLSLLALGLSVPAIMWAAMAYLKRTTAWSASTAFFATVPGALSYVAVLTLESKADSRLVLLAQMLRVTVLMAVLPPLIAASQAGAPPPVPPEHAGILSGWGAVVMLLAAGTAAGWMALRSKVPAGLMLGAMTASAVLHLSGTIGTAAQLPPPVVAAASVMLGVYTGTRFQGASLDDVRAALVPSLGMLAVSLSVAVLFAAGVSWGLAMPFGQVMVAFAPGGLEAMMILALLLGLDPAYVGAHQFARLIGISLFLPLFARRHLRRTD